VSATIEPAAPAASVAPTGGAYARDLAFATAVARDAGRIQLDRYERLERIDRKSAHDVVTEADHLSEAHILAAIREAFPGDAILAEESGAHARSDGTAATASVGRTWVVDPLDGTINYANGIPFYCVSVALVEDGRPVVGVVHDPSRGEVYAATADGPATLDGRVIVASAKAQLADFVVSMALGGRNAASRYRAVRKAIRISRSMGSAALALAYVGNGRFDAFAQEDGLSAWDVAAAGLVAERAGATVTDLGGGPWFDIGKPPNRLGVLAAPAAHHAALLALVRP